MRPRTIPLVVALASALAGSTVLPPDHLHRSTAARPEIIHAHWELVEHSATSAAFSAQDDDHHDVIVLDSVLAAGASPYAPSHPAALSRAVCVTAAISAEFLPPQPDTAPTPSPPPRRSAPRAPPA